MTKLVCLLMAGSACALAQTVEGSVFNAASGAGGRRGQGGATQGRGGRFPFDNVRAADYAARYQAPEYRSTAGPSDYRTFHIDYI